MITGINHIGIAVKNIEESLKLYTGALGLILKEIEVIDDGKMRIAIIPVGGSMIELLEATDPDGTIAKFIERKGEGLHHLALEVNNIEGTLKELSKKGIPLIDEKPKEGAENSRIAFLHPKGTKVLMELVEPNPGK